MQMVHSDVTLMLAMTGSVLGYDIPKVLKLTKSERACLARASTICDKAAELLGSDDPYNPDTDCPFLNAASWLNEVNS